MMLRLSELAAGKGDKHLEPELLEMLKIDRIPGLHIQLFADVFKHQVVMFVHRADLAVRLGNPVFFGDPGHVAGEVVSLFLGQEKRFLHVLALHIAVQGELYPFAFLRVGEHFVVQVHVVIDVIVGQRVPLDVQMTGFEYGHGGSSGRLKRADLQIRPTASTVVDSGLGRAHARARGAFDDVFDIRQRADHRDLAGVPGKIAGRLHLAE